MKLSMTIDIICPLYNAEKYIKDLDAILKKQKNVEIKNINYLLTESKDNTENILKELNCTMEFLEKILEVPNTSFIPEPAVTSEVIKIKIRKQPPVEIHNEKAFFNLIKIAFLQRRKTLLNALTNNGISDKETLSGILKELNIDEKIRSEKLKIEDFASISNILYK